MINMFGGNNTIQMKEEGAFFIRGFKYGDLDRIMDIEKLSFILPWTRGQVVHEFHANPKGIKVAVAGGEVAGYAILRIEIALDIWHFKIYRHCHLLKLAVDPEYRQRGVGGKLLAEAERFARIKKVREVTLEVRVKNASARRFYRKRGYREVKYDKDFYRDDDAVVMAKPL